MVILSEACFYFKVNKIVCLDRGPHFTLQNLPKLCSVVADCASLLSVDFWLQTNMHQCGILWHLLLFLFNYDYTLEEAGVEKSEETNQQVGQEKRHFGTETSLNQKDVLLLHYPVQTWRVCFLLHVALATFGIFLQSVANLKAS